MIDAQVLGLVQELAAKNDGWFRLAYVSKRSEFSKEEAVQELDKLVAEGYLERGWDVSCPDCARTQKQGPDHNEVIQSVIKQGQCFSCLIDLSEFNIWGEPIYSPSARLKPELTKIEIGPRQRPSSLAAERAQVSTEPSAPER